MKYLDLVRTLDNTGLSAEQLAPILGISNMTIRRWKKESSVKIVPKAYERLLVDGILQMVNEGILQADASWVQDFLASSNAYSVSRALSGLGVREADLAQKGGQQDRLIGFLRFIGLSPKHRSEVDTKIGEIRGFRKLDREWRRVVTHLLVILKSKNLAQIDKLIAYGAFFYLLCPLDLIPDGVPVFGYLDDFAFLSLAATYYLKNFPAEKMAAIHARI